ncbi:hypothetical protein IU459_35885 [Nocardia amamiensis]|uniref:Uncharacterized protein n=1 Tax=Nocardia amamiensis TaxID=404578 RepID=A0ABS0D6S4_9NOCA|nr:hypothetical protein [Nocardia amamiensis]MBF6302864.1 hypothetical protein [Nocardia amamiensis]
MDSAALVADIATHGGEDLGESLINARDVAAVLQARADRLIGEHTQSTTVPPSAAADVETLAYSPTSDDTALTTATAAFNDTEVLSTKRQGGRFVALRDAELPAVAPVPSRHPGLDLELAEFAEGLRACLLDTDAERLADNRPTVPVTAEDKEAVLDSYAEAANPVDRRAKIQRDYEHYVRELAHERGCWLLDRAFPTALVHQVERSRQYPSLLDTIALADAHGLDTDAMMAALIDGTDHGRALITARDAADVLRSRADEWIADHAITSIEPTTAVLVALGYDNEDQAAELTALAVARNTGTDVLAAQPRPDRWRALDELAPPRGLRSIPPEHPGMDRAMADYADELRRLLLELPDAAPDWRVRAAAQAAATAVNEDADLDIEFDAEFGDTAAEPESGGNEIEPEDDWAEFTNTDVRPSNCYPELSRTARAMRINTDLAAAREQVGQLFDQVMSRTHPHQLAIEPKIAEMRLRMDALHPLVLAARDAHERWEEAEFDAITAEDAYQTALRAHPEAVDEQFIDSMQERIDALDDPALRSRLVEQLELYRAAATETAGEQIARTKDDADSARAYADELRGEAEAAKQELDAAAGGQPVPTEDEVHTWRGMAEDLATAELNAARAEAARLDTFAFHATQQAANQLRADTGVSHSQALWELENRYQQAAADRAAAETASVTDEGEPSLDPETPPSPTGPLTDGATQQVEAEADQDTGPAVDEEPADPAAAREHQVLEQMQAEPIRMRSDTELDSLIRTLRRTASQRDDPTAWQGLAAAQSRAEQLRAEHARLAEQVEAIEAAQTAEAAADQAARTATQASAATREARQTLAGIPSRRSGARRDAQQLVDASADTERRKKADAEAAREAAHAAIDAARDAGAPKLQWPAVLARANNRAALAAELEAAELDDAHDEEMRERAAQRAARAARDLETALAERERRTDLSPVDAATEHRIRAAHGTRPAAAAPNRPSSSSRPPPKPRPTGNTTMTTAPSCDRMPVRAAKPDHGEGLRYLRCGPRGSLMMLLGSLDVWLSGSSLRWRG